MATRKMVSSLSYTNWATGYPAIGYVYIDAATGEWKSEYSLKEKITLCVEMTRGELSFLQKSVYNLFRDVLGQDQELY
jgi:hypothetical protein